VGRRRRDPGVDVMPDPFNEIRPTREGLLARLMARLLGEQKKRVTAEIAPVVIEMDHGFWLTENEHLQLPLMPQLQSAAEEAAGVMALEIGIGVDVGFINLEALEWATTYSYDLVQGLNSTSRAVVEKALAEYIATPGLTLQDFADMIAPTFGPIRAEMIAVTETTRAYYEGGAIAARKIMMDTGIEMVEIWNTSNDELVCEICAPLNLTARYPGPQGDYEYGWEDGPPAHPRCRCGVTYEFP